MSRVLVLEDEPLIAMMLEDWLLEIGHEPVGPAATIASALELVQQRSPEVAILDLSINGQTSYVVADLLVERGVPFAFATGHGTAQLSAPHDGAPVLGKPYDFESVKAMMVRLLG
ncbi:MAG TPA: response regulator [Bauldia sp.]|nr:response regulator [Bauldia sp.]